MMRVLGIGDNVVDKYLSTRTMYPGGNALNFCVYARQSGAESAYIGVFGTDEAASHIKKTLTTLGVDYSRSRTVEGENGYAMVNLVDGDRVFVGSNKCGVLRSHPIVIGPDDAEYIKAFDLIHTSCNSYIEGELTKLHDIGIPISYDFSNRGDDAYFRMVCPNVAFSFLSCGHMDDGETRKLLAKIFGFGSSMAVGTMGERGAWLFDGESFYHQEARIVEAKDTMGAGDSFLTAFLIAYLGRRRNGWAGDGGQAVRESLSEAALFAAKICMVDGAFGYGENF